MRVKADRELAAGVDRGPLHGVPISIKDIVDIRKTPTTAASRVQEGHLAKQDAGVVARLRHAGAVFVGKNNLHEFAYGDQRGLGVRAPSGILDPSRSPGGSSGKVGCERCGRHGLRHDRHGYWRIHTNSGRGVRRCRPEAELRRNLDRRSCAAVRERSTMWGRSPAR